MYGDYWPEAGERQTRCVAPAIGPRPLLVIPPEIVSSAIQSTERIELKLSYDDLPRGGKCTGWERVTRHRKSNLRIARC
jgi:hypothetical protein